MVGRPDVLLTDRKIVRDSTAMDFTMLGEEDPDAAILEWSTRTPSSRRGAKRRHLHLPKCHDPSVSMASSIVTRLSASAASPICSPSTAARVVTIGVEYEGKAITSAP